VLDATLPDGDGYDFCRELSDHPNPAETLPVLLLTGKAGLDQRMKAMLNGARKYLEKPFDIDILVETVNSMTRVMN